MLKSLIFSSVFVLLQAPAWGAVSVIDGNVVNGARFSEVIEFEVFRGEELSSCSGILIAPQVVLTAAHCVYGNVDLSFSERVEPRSIHIPESYKAYRAREEQGEKGLERLKITFDQAIIVLDKALGKQSSYPLLQLHSMPQAASAELVGWGGEKLLSVKDLNQKMDDTVGVLRSGKTLLEGIFSSGLIETKRQFYRPHHWYNVGEQIASSSKHLAMSARGDSGGGVYQDGVLVGVLSSAGTDDEEGSIVYSRTVLISGLYSGVTEELLRNAGVLNQVTLK